MQASGLCWLRWRWVWHHVHRRHVHLQDRAGGSCWRSCSLARAALRIKPLQRHTAWQGRLLTRRSAARLPIDRSRPCQAACGLIVVCQDHDPPLKAVQEALHNVVQHLDLWQPHSALTGHLQEHTCLLCNRARWHRIRAASSTQRMSICRQQCSPINHVKRQSSTVSSATDDCDRASCAAVSVVLPRQNRHAGLPSQLHPGTIAACVCKQQMRFHATHNVCTPAEPMSSLGNIFVQNIYCSPALFAVLE